MQKLQQQLSDTSGPERGGGLAVELANYGGEWTTFHVNLEDGTFGGGAPQSVTVLGRVCVYVAGNGGGGLCCRGRLRTNAS